MFKGFAGLDKGKTFRPRRHHKAGTKRYELHKYAQATLGAGNLHDAVTLPDGEDVNEWLAVNTVDFFNEMCAPLSPRGRRACLRLTPCVALCRSNLLYGIIAEFCTETACPVMCAGPKYEYMWADGQTIKKPISCSAPRYVDYLLTWVPATPPNATLHRTYRRSAPHAPLPAPLPAPRSTSMLVISADKQ